ncbi:MAG: hypothetical protein CO170_01400 [candidate division SR1 bacterium CG_4_9_14_3_um_filter_40_9]|nr:MAG: hypothetical protein CO170_01400 [candidate division SR1 bacterium CG_4_9_14_3_um_filter_40_9]
MEPAQILFSDSNLYFQDTSSLQSNIGFINPMDIDIYVKKSFSCFQEPVNIIGGYIQAFNSSHRIDQACTCYKINLTNNQPLLQAEGIITFDLEHQGFINQDMIKNLIQGLPIIAIALLSLLTLVAPAPIATSLRYISIIGMVVMIFYYGRKMIKMFYKMLKAKGVDYEGVMVYYEKNSDLLNINKEYIAILKELRIMKIEKIVAKNGEFYLKQTIEKPSFRKIIKGIFVTMPSDETVIQQTIENTIRFLLQTSFIVSYANNSAMKGGSIDVVTIKSS